MCLKRRPLTHNEERVIDIQVDIHEEGEISPYPSNFISTSRYTSYNFLPFSLLLQFKRYANIYFLIIAILQSIPQISPLTPFSAIAPLVFVLGISMLREGMEDYSRHKSDAKTNSEKTTRIIASDTLIEEKITWREVEVGDILKIYEDEPFPADLIAVDSSYANGVCYIETGALDGEKNMKPKSCLRETYQIFKDSRLDSIRTIKLQAEKPNQELYKFNGSFEGLFEEEQKNDLTMNTNNKNALKKQDSMQKIIEEVDRIVNEEQEKKTKQIVPQPALNSDADSINNQTIKDKNKQVNLSTQNGYNQTKRHPSYTQMKVLISAKQLLLRGAFLRNTEYILGMVVYTGKDAKIMKNSEEPKLKSSNMENTMNTYIIGILILQLVCSAFTALLGYFWNSNHLDGHWYLYDPDQIDQYGALAVLYFFTYFLLYNTMIPISLIVSLEMVKVAQGYFIQKDELMYCAEKDIWPRVMTTTINEELGQVEYIFSDKTGTLTCNVMEFNKSVIGHKLYGEAGKPKELIEKEKQNRLKDENNGKKPKLVKFNFYDEHLNDLLAKGMHDSTVDLQFQSEDNKASYCISTQRDLACEYWKLLSTAHECIIQKDKATGEIDYQGPSPDEITLVDAARHMGFVFEGASSDTVDLNVRGVRQKLKLLNTFEFNSDRKRMSAIVKDGDVYKLYIKGADSIIKSRLHKTKNQPFLEKTNDYLTQFSLIGLRTLMMAMRVLSESEYAEFKKKLTDLSDSPNREELTDKLVDQIERNLILIGATAVEDKLQDKVPETIYDLIKANIKVWMLTGDKLETAENIAKSCKLIQSDMFVMTISDKTEEDLTKNLLGTAMDKFNQLQASKQKKSLLVEGESLTLIFNNPVFQKAFLAISQHCESVVCCRVTPKQKALVVRLIKDNLKKITLAIGDGANDVNMIQEAHIGCGIFGNEGMQAAQSSDFAFGEFKCLWRLVLVHGRWSYIRISEMIVYFFYKNMLFTIPQLYFSFFNAYSGQTIFDAWFISLYNLVFTALPLISRAIFDQDINYKVSVDQVKMGIDDDRLEKILERKEEYLEKKYPTFYYTSQQKTIFTDTEFVSWALQGLLHGLVIFFATYLSFDSITFSKNGLSSDLWNFSLIVFSAIILVANLKIALFTRYWTYMSYISIFITSLTLYFAFLLASQVIETSEVYLTPFEMFKHCQFYLIIFFSCGVVLTFDMIVFIARQFLTKNRIFSYMRFMTNPKVTLERKPSWADEMSIFNSFYNLGDKENQKKSGNVYMQNSDDKLSQKGEKKQSIENIKNNNLIENGRGQHTADNQDNQDNQNNITIKPMIPFEGISLASPSQPEKRQQKNYNIGGVEVKDPFDAGKQRNLLAGQGKDQSTSITPDQIQFTDMPNKQQQQQQQQVAQSNQPNFNNLSEILTSRGIGGGAADYCYGDENIALSNKSFQSSCKVNNFVTNIQIPHNFEEIYSFSELKQQSLQPKSDLQLCSPNLNSANQSNTNLRH